MFVCVFLVFTCLQLHNFITASAVSVDVGTWVRVCVPDLFTQVMRVYFLHLNSIVCVHACQWLNLDLLYIHCSACQGDCLVTDYFQTLLAWPPSTFPGKSIDTHSVFHCVMQPNGGFLLFWTHVPPFTFYLVSWPFWKLKTGTFHSPDVAADLRIHILLVLVVTWRCSRAVLPSPVRFYSPLSCFVHVFTQAFSGPFCFVTVYQLNLMVVCLSILWRMSGHRLKRPDELSGPKPNF